MGLRQWVSRPSIRRTDDRPLADRPGRGQVLLHQYRRQAQDVADVVEAVPHIIEGEILGRPEVHPDQVTDGIVILGAIQAAGSSRGPDCPGDRSCPVPERP